MLPIVEDAITSPKELIERIAFFKLVIANVEVVACDVVEFCAVKFWRVVLERARIVEAKVEDALEINP